MPIPDYQSLMRPVLSYLADGEVRLTREVREAVTDGLELTVDERAQMLPSGKVRLVDDRIGWAIKYVAQAGLIVRPSRGRAQITDRGREVLAAHPVRIDNTVLQQFDEFRAFKTRARESSTGQVPLDSVADWQPAMDTPTAPATSSVTATPSDLIAEAVSENRARVQSDVLSAALALTPTGFEDLVIALLSAMGYGRAGMAERTSTTGDAGIDGIISQDPLGLDRIYVQAKRYAEDRAVDLPLLNEFAGALQLAQGDRGVFITTSRFTDGARRAAERINARIELIDGRRLAQLLVDYGVGVQPEQQVTLYRLDEDFFDTL